MRNELGYLGDSRNDGLSFGDPHAGPDKQQRWCGVCGTECVVERAVHGPTSRWEAMRDGGHLHDVFRCPHYGSQWHDLAHRLAKESVATASRRLRALIEADLDELVAGNLGGQQCA